MKIKKLAISIAIPVISGFIVGLISSSYTNYTELNLPSFAPPSILFPIVWTILYTLMGISAYLVDDTKSYNKRKALSIYKIQLVINLLWSIIFFVFNLKTLAFIWIILLIIAVISMIRNFYNISKLAGLLQIPYLLWLIFASILNLSILFLN